MLNWLTTQFLKTAAKRWPADRRDDRLLEWQGELSWLRGEPGANRIRRTWTELRFGWSLAMSPRIAPDGSSMGWREMLPGVARGLQPVLALIAVVVAGSTLSPLARSAGDLVYDAIYGRPAGLGQAAGFNWVANSLSVAGLALVSVALFLTGRWLGRRGPLAWAHRGRFIKSGSAVLAPAIIVLTLGAIDFVTSFRDHGFGEVYLAPDPWPAFGIWAVLAAAVAITVIALARSGRRLMAWIVAISGMVITLDLAGAAAGWRAALKVDLELATAPLWFPLTVLDLEGSGIAFGTIEQGLIDSESVVRMTAGPLRSLLVFTFFLIGYGLAASRAELSSQPQVVRLPESTSAAAPWGKRQWAGAGAAVAFITLWGYALTVLTGALNQETDEVGEHHIWAHELRQAAILGIIAALWLMLAGQGPVVVPAIVTSAVLMTADSIADSNDATGLDTAFGVAGLAIAVLCGAWMLSRLLARGLPRSATANRRALIAMAVILVFAAPANSFHVPNWPTKLPWGFFVGNAVIVGLLVAAGLTCALAARQRPIRTVSAVAIVLPVSVLSGYLSVFLIGGGPVFVLAGGPLAVLAIFLARPHGKVFKWAGLVLASLIVAIPLAYVELMASLIVGEALMTSAGYIFPADGLPLFPGAVIVGVIAATLIATVVVPRPAPAAVMPEPSLATES